jgi:hypothetical protein
VVRLRLPRRRRCGARTAVLPPGGARSCRCPQTCGCWRRRSPRLPQIGPRVSVGTGHDGSVRCACGTAAKVLGLSGRPASAADTCHCPEQGGDKGQVAALSRAWTGGRWPSTVRAGPPAAAVMGGRSTHWRPAAGRRRARPSVPVARRAARRSGRRGRPARRPAGRGGRSQAHTPGCRPAGGRPGAAASAARAARGPAVRAGPHGPAVGDPGRHGGQLPGQAADGGGPAGLCQDLLHQPDQPGPGAGSLGAGALAGSLLFGAVGRHWPRRRTFLTCWVLGAAGRLRDAGRHPAASGPGGRGVRQGLLFGPINPLAVSVIQEHTPPQMLGRVFGRSPPWPRPASRSGRSWPAS